MILVILCLLAARYGFRIGMRISQDRYPNLASLGQRAVFGARTTFQALVTFGIGGIALIFCYYFPAHVGPYIFCPILAFLLPVVFGYMGLIGEKR